MSIEKTNSNENKERIYINYTAEFVEDIKDLLNKFPPKHEKIFGHHSIVVYKPASLDGIEIGKESSMKIIGRAYDEKGDALLVDNLKSNNKHPHITLSCTSGTSQFYSNELIENAINDGTVEYFDNPIEIKVIEGYYDGKKDVLNV